MVIIFHISISVRTCGSFGEKDTEGESEGDTAAADK